MPRPQRYRLRLSKLKPAPDYLRNLSDRRPQAVGEQRAGALLSTAGILRLQRTIGNQAVQRLIARDKPAGEKAKEEAAVPAVVASITFAKRGELAGSSHVAGHEGEVELDSLNFVQTGAGGRQDKDRKFIELVATRAVDKSSAALARAAIDGDQITAARFDFLRRGDGGTVETSFTLEFKKGFVTNYSAGGTGDRPGESVSMQFEAQD
jgi:type VI protein secretion system component Hcp